MGKFRGGSGEAKQRQNTDMPRPKTLERSDSTRTLQDANDRRDNNAHRRSQNIHQIRCESRLLANPIRRLLTTFNTPFGRYCYKRIPFEIKSAQEVFQKRMCQSFGDLEGVETDVDDILVWESTVKEHDERLKKTLQRCQKYGLHSTRSASSV